jgi:hypothetical protein
MKLYIRILLCTASCFFFSCSSLKSDLLVGHWQAFEVLEEGEPLMINPEEITITFTEDESYTYNSTLNYLESGNYYLDAKYLYTLDTINQASTEKAVEIIKLTTDSLVLRMNEGTKERILKLVKQ